MILNYSASFSFWYARTYRRPLTRPERLIIEQLERRRHASGMNNVLFAINDPSRRYTLLLATYAAWFQRTFCPTLNSAVFVPETRTQAADKYSYLSNLLSGLTLRTCRQKHWVPCAPFGIAILYGADLYCPSYANWRRPKVQTFLAQVLPSMPLRNHLILIVGDASHRRTAFAAAFTGRLRRTRHPEIHCFRPKNLTFSEETYVKLNVEQPNMGREFPNSRTEAKQESLSRHSPVPPVAPADPPPGAEGAGEDACFPVEFPLKILA